MLIWNVKWKVLILIVGFMLVLMLFFFVEFCMVSELEDFSVFIDV